MEQLVNDRDGLQSSFLQDRDANKLVSVITQGEAPATTKTPEESDTPVLIHSQPTETTSSIHSDPVDPSKSARNNVLNDDE